MKEKTSEPNKETLKAFKETDKGKGLVRHKSFQEIKAFLLKSADPLDDEIMARNFWALLKSNDVEGLIDLLKLYVTTHGRRDLHAKLSSMSKNPTLKTICKIVNECCKDDCKMLIVTEDGAL